MRLLSAWSAWMAGNADVSMNEKNIFTTARDALQVVGSFGGLVYLVTLLNLWRNRVRVKVRVLSRHKTVDLTNILHFEAENLGSTSTSIKPQITFSGFLPRPLARTSYGRKMRRFDFEFAIDGTNRTLQPHVPVRFEARSQNTKTYVLERLGFMFFNTYTFSFTRSRTRKVRIYSADDNQINVIQYCSGRFLVAVLGVYGFRKPKDRSEEVADALSR
jgi:hypothetical protein